jgi:hypothetical protein
MLFFSGRELVESEAELLGIGQPGGVVEADELRTRFHVFAGQ